MIVSVDTEKIEQGDLDEIRKLCLLTIDVIDRGIQLSFLPPGTAPDLELFDFNEPLPDDVLRPDGKKGPDGIYRRWMTINEAAPFLGRSPAWVYRNLTKLRIATRKVGGRIYIDATKFRELVSIIKHL
jgi:hypothetical protein